MTAALQPDDCVVCIDDSPPKHSACRNPSPVAKLVCGAIYRITAAFPAASGSPVVLVGDAPHTCDAHHGYGGWDPARFRKIDDEVEESFRLMLRSLKSKSPAAYSPRVSGSEDVYPRNARTSSPHIPAGVLSLRRPPSEPGCVPARALGGE